MKASELNKNGYQRSHVLREASMQDSESNSKIIY